MKDRKYKYVEDIIDDYIDLTDELIEIPLLIEKASKKFNQHLSQDRDVNYTLSQAETLFKYHSQVERLEERKKIVAEELVEVENAFQNFLSVLKGAQIVYEKKDDNDKSKITFLFWLEANKVMCNR